MLRTAQSLPLTGLSTLGFDPTRFQTEPPACYRASWQLPGPDLHRQATTSLRPRSTTPVHLQVRWAHGGSRLRPAQARNGCPGRSLAAQKPADLEPAHLAGSGRSWGPTVQVLRGTS